MRLKLKASVRLEPLHNEKKKETKTKIWRLFEPVLTNDKDAFLLLFKSLKFYTINILIDVAFSFVFYIYMMLSVKYLGEKNYKHFFFLLYYNLDFHLNYRINNTILTITTQK